MHALKVKNLHWLAALALTLGAGAFISLVNSCSTMDRVVVEPLQIEGATFVGSKACLDCHANISRAFPSSPHARLHLEKSLMAGQTGCESCHGPGSKHIAVGGNGREKFIINPGKDPEACFRCHLETQAEFHFPNHHPVVEGRMNCVQCHDPHGMDIMKPAGGLAMARQNESCANCHRQQTRPVVFEHEAMRDGCTACHQPHGSINHKMIVENDPNLCLRCHAQVQDPANGSGTILIGGFDHTAFMSRATCWASGCHTAVHGSNVDPWLRY